MRAWFNRLRRRLARALLFRIVYGERSQGHALAYTRISPSTCIEHEERLVLGDHVFIGAFNFIEASGGVVIEEGVQICNFVSITSHSSHRSQRLLGRAFATWAPPRPAHPTTPAEPTLDAGPTLPPDPAAPAAARFADSEGRMPGWIGAPIHIGAYSFIGPHVLVEAGTRIGRGCIVCAGSALRGDYTDFAILEGRPARVIGDSRVADARLLARYPELLPHWQAWAGAMPSPENPASGRRRRPLA